MIKCCMTISEAITSLHLHCLHNLRDVNKIKTFEIETAVLALEMKEATILGFVLDYTDAEDIDDAFIINAVKSHDKRCLHEVLFNQDLTFKHKESVEEVMTYVRENKLSDILEMLTRSVSTTHDSIDND